MDVVQFFQRMVRETSETRLMKHCRGMNVALTSFRASALSDSLGERTSSIFIAGANARVGVKVHFDLDTAVTWAAQSIGKSKDDVEDPDAIDFMREFSNLHAGHLRGLLENAGEKFGMSLPFITAGEDAPAVSGQGSVATDTWVLTDGDLQVVCTSEIEISNPAALEQICAPLALLLEADAIKSAKGEDDGEVEFFI